MDSSSIQLPGSEIAGATLQDGDLHIRFARARIVKTMTGAAESTLWWQAGTLILSEAELEAPLPEGAAVCAGGDLEQGIYVYRDMIPVPLLGGAGGRCEFKLQDSAARIVARGRGIRLELLDVPRYIEHQRAGAAG